MERPGMRRIPGRLWRTLLAAAALAAAVGAFLAWGPIGLGNGPLSVGGGADYGPDPKLAPLAVLDPVEAGGTGAVIDSVALVGGSYPAPRRTPRALVSCQSTVMKLCSGAASNRETCMPSSAAPFLSSRR